MHVWMDGWMEGWMDGCMYVIMYVGRYVCMHYVHACMHVYIVNMSVYVCVSVLFTKNVSIYWGKTVHMYGRSSSVPSTYTRI